MTKRIAAHVHKLRRKTYKSTGTKIYFCTLPDCYFKTEPDLLVGKESICNRCGKVFLLNTYSITLSKPHCDECTINRGNHYEKRTAKRRLTEDRRHESLPLTAEISGRIGNDITSDLEKRLRNAASVANDYNDDDDEGPKLEPVIFDTDEKDDDL